MELSATVSAWEETLAPWIHALEHVHLCHIMRMVHNTTGPRECWWGIGTSLRPPREFTAEMWTLVREAMELLDLLSRVEPQVTRMIFAAIAGTLDPEAKRQRPRFQIKVDDVWEALDVFTQRGILHLLTHDGRAASETYESVKTTLLAQWTSTHSGRALDRAADGHVELAIEFTLGDDDEPASLQALRTLALAHTRDTPTTHDPFVLHSLQIRLTRADGTPVSDATLQQLNDIVAAGVPITHLYLTSLLGAHVNRALLGEFMLRNFVRGDGRGVRDLEISATDFDAIAVASLCTAIARSTSLDNVYFEVVDVFDDGGGVQTAVWWQWLAYALFSRHTSHAIRSAQLNLSSLTMNHIRSIRELLRDDHPLSLLYQTLRTAVNAHEGMASLRQAATVRLGRHDDPAAAEGGLDRAVIHVEEQTPVCQVVRDRPGESFVEIVLPGAGVCCVGRADVVEVKPLEVRNSHPVRELRISEGEFGGEVAQPIIEFLHLVGGPLERLEVFHGDLVGDAFGNTIITACTELQHLRLQSLRLESLEWLLNVPSTCKLHTLCCRLGKNVVQWSTSWPRLFAALGDMTHPLTLSLRYLQINLQMDVQRFGQGDDPEEDAICQGFVAMLDKNWLLQHCELLSCSETASATYKTRFLAHHDDPLAEEESPLPLAQKLAFLSVISPVEGPPSPHKQPKTTPLDGRIAAPMLPQAHLTPEAVGKVFTFAATPKRRICRITRQMSH